MHSAQLTWTWHGKTVDLGFDTSGQGRRYYCCLH
jgi:hypothetical protein